MRKFEGLISEERETELNTTEGMSYDEIVGFYKSHPELLTENEQGWGETDLSPKELCEKYGLVDMTNVFISHGVNIQD